MSDDEPSGVAAAQALQELAERSKPALTDERAKWVAESRAELAAVLGVDPDELPEEQLAVRRGSPKVTFTVAGLKTMFLRFHAVHELPGGWRWVVERVQLDPPGWAPRGRFGHGLAVTDSERQEWPTTKDLDDAETALYWLFDELSERRVLQAYWGAAPHYMRYERQLRRRAEVGYVVDAQWMTPLS